MFCFAAARWGAQFILYRFASLQRSTILRMYFHDIGIAFYRKQAKKIAKVVLRYSHSVNHCSSTLANSYSAPRNAPNAAPTYLLS